MVWGIYALDVGGGLASPIAQSAAVYLALLVVTARSRRIKVPIVRTFQRWTINLLMRALLAVGLNPLGLARDHRQDVRATAPHAGRKRTHGRLILDIAEHGDARRLRAQHPVLNAINVRVLGADLLTVHVQLMLDVEPARAAQPGASVARPSEPRPRVATEHTEALGASQGARVGVRAERAGAMVASNSRPAADGVCGRVSCTSRDRVHDVASSIDGPTASVGRHSG